MNTPKSEEDFPNEQSCFCLNITFGVPQGSVLGLVLFHFYTCMLPLGQEKRTHLKSEKQILTSRNLSSLLSSRSDSWHTSFCWVSFSYLDFGLSDFTRFQETRLYNSHPWNAKLAACYRTDFKLLLLTFKAPHDLAPECILDLIAPYESKLRVLLTVNSLLELCSGGSPCLRTLVLQSQFLLLNHKTYFYTKAF